MLAWTQAWRCGKLRSCEQSLCRPASESSTSMNAVKAPVKSRSFWGFVWRQCAGFGNSLSTGHTPAANSFMWAQDAVNVQAQDPPAKTGGRAGNCRAGGLGRAHGPPDSDIDDVDLLCVCIVRTRRRWMPKQRADWHVQLAGQAAARLVFVDESGANTKLTRWRGRALGGHRLVARVPHGHYQTSTLIAAIRLTGTCAPWLFDGAMDGEMFLAWVREGLVPALQQDDLVIMDNLAAHKVQGMLARPSKLSVPGCCICRPIHRISTPSKTCGARSSKSSAAWPRAHRRN